LSNLAVCFLIEKHNLKMQHFFVTRRALSKALMHQAPVLIWEVSSNELIDGQLVHKVVERRFTIKRATSQLVGKTRLTLAGLGAAASLGKSLTMCHGMQHGNFAS
jgi:hypothetical protein